MNTLHLPAYVESQSQSHLWRDTCTELGITVKKTRPYRPQTNGQIERFHRTLANEWAFSRFYATEPAHRNAQPAIGAHPTHQPVNQRPWP